MSRALFAYSVACFWPVRSYFVRQCNKPKGRAAIALAVRVGSVVEEADTQGVAHMVEHLAFNATEHRSNHEIVRFLESIGAQFGACQVCIHRAYAYPAA